jgi:hypothetical protein
MIYGNVFLHILVAYCAHTAVLQFLISTQPKKLEFLTGGLDSNSIPRLNLANLSPDSHQFMDDKRNVKYIAY